MKSLYSELEKKIKGKFEHWNCPHSSHDYGTANTDFLNSIMAEGVELCSVLIYSDYYFSSRLYTNKKYFTSKKVRVLSPVEMNVYSALRIDNNAITEIIDKEVNARFKKTRKSKDFFKYFDLILEEKKKTEYYPAAVNHLLTEEAFYYIENKRKNLFNQVNSGLVNENEAVKIIFKEKPELKIHFLKKIKARTTETRYTRYYKHQLPINLSKVFSGFGWTQFYIMRVGNIVHVASGSSSGSGTRESHGFLAHHFALAQKKGKNISTYIVDFDSRFKRTILKSNELVIHGHDLTGNFNISSELSKAILSKTKLIFSINDLTKVGT